MSDARREVAHALKLMEHEWYWEDPENGDIFCRHCEVQDYTQTLRGPCPARPAPSRSALLTRIEASRVRAWEELIRLAELDERLDETVSGT